MQLRLLLFEDCNRSCAGCCNKDWDLKSLPVITDFTGYDLIMLTGGEPLLNPDLVRETVQRIREQTDTPIILYTAMVDRDALEEIAWWVDGITLTLHDHRDGTAFVEVYYRLWRSPAVTESYTPMSLRLNIFAGVRVPLPEVWGWQIKKNIRWIKNCPLPTNEVFGRIA